MRRSMMLLSCAGLLLAACSDDTSPGGADGGADMTVQKDEGPGGSKDGKPADGPAIKPDGPAVTPDGPAITQDGPATKPDGPVTKPDGPVTKPDGPVTKPDSGSASCKAMAVKGVGACEKLLGYYWDGAACKALTGCSCSGADCAKLYSSSAACSAAHAHCGKAKCSAWDAKGQGPCTLFLGVIWDGKKCTGIGGCSCVGVDCKNIYTTLTKCQAGQAHCP